MSMLEGKVLGWVLGMSGGGREVSGDKEREGL